MPRPFPPLVVCGCHAVRHLPWFKVTRDQFLADAAFALSLDAELAEMALCEFAIERGYHRIDPMVVWMFFREFR